MKIGILGTGRVGGSLARVLTSKGHTVKIGTRDPKSEKVVNLLASINGDIQADSVSNTIDFAEVVFIATPWDVTRDIVLQGSNWQGKIAIDCTNPIELTPEGLAKGLTIGHNTSAGEEIARWIPNAKIVKALNTMGANIYENPNFGSSPATAFLCSDDGEAKQVAISLLSDMGLVPVDVGELNKARLLEPVGSLWIHLALLTGMGPDIAINLVKR
jgi:hypothetical protein